MVKLNERKIRWIIHEKLRGRGAGELALIQRISHRRVEQLWQAYKQTGIIPTLKTPGRPKGEPIHLHEAALVLKVYDELKVNALTLERVLRDIYQVKLPHNAIHMVLKEAGRAMPEPSKQRRRKCYGVFKEATADNALLVLKQAIAKYGPPREILTDRGSQFYASEGERKEKGISQFEQYLADNGIKHILCRVNHPQTNGKLERSYGVYDQKKHQFKSIDEYVHWHNEIKPHLSLNIETLETPIQAFYRKLPLEKTEITKTAEPLVK